MFLLCGRRPGLQGLFLETVILQVGGWGIETQIINNNSHQLPSLKDSKDDVLSDNPSPQRIGFFSTWNRVDVKIHLQFLPFYKGAAKWRNYRRGTQQSFYTKKFHPEVQPLTFYIPLLTDKVPLWYVWFAPFTDRNDRFQSQPFNILQLVKLGSRCFIIHLTPEKGTPFERSLAVLAIVGNTSRPFSQHNLLWLASCHLY